MANILRSSIFVLFLAVMASLMVLPAQAQSSYCWQWKWVWEWENRTVMRYNPVTGNMDPATDLPRFCKAGLFRTSGLAARGPSAFPLHQCRGSARPVRFIAVAVLHDTH